MADEDSRVIRQIYAGALQRDPEERDEYLDGACAGRPDLRARIATLLQAHASDFEDTRISPIASTPISDLTGRRIGTYVIRHEIGRGGMGVVYLADDTRLSRAVAIKALSPGINQMPGLRERLLNEARLAAGLSHPGIATVYALEEIDGELYLACEYVPGPPLRALVRSGALPSDEVVDIGVQLAKALAEAHTKGIVHRDIKPENVIKTPSGVVKILDFGLARAENSANARLTQTGMIMGTPAYLAPEQALGRPADFRTDIFALGLLLYELASGANPFAAESITATIARIVEADPPPLSGAPELDRIIHKCLRKDPHERYGSTQEVVADLERLRSGAMKHLSSTSAAAGADPDIRRRGTPQRWLVVHQVLVSIVYIAMLFPAWRARDWLGAPWNMVFLLSVLAAAAAGTSLRLHLCFIANTFPGELPAQRAWTWRWTRLCDVTFAAAQLAAAVAIGGAHAAFAMLFVGVSAALLVASFVIEPATARAALPPPTASTSSSRA